MTAKLELLDRRLRQRVRDLRRNFDFRYQADRHPWPIFAASILIGFLLGRRIGRRPFNVARSASRAAEKRPAAEVKTGATIHDAQDAQDTQDTLRTELAAIKGLAVAAVMRTAFGMIRRALTRRSSEEPSPAHGGHNGGGPAERRVS